METIVDSAVRSVAQADVNKVLVTGADQHQGLAVIRGLGRAGIPVIAASPVGGALGQVSRYATERMAYAPPQHSPSRFVRDVLQVAGRPDVSMIMAVSESTLVALDNRREEIERVCRLAAPNSSVLAGAIDKQQTMRLADEAGVPAPRSYHSDNLAEVLESTREFRFPLVLKPRGNALYRTTKNRLGFKVRYARSPAELRKVLLHFEPGGSLPLVQEFVSGYGLNVTVLADRGTPVVMVPYRKVRELPLTGGVSVVRRTLPLSDTLRGHVTRLLRAARWHGVAMVEFKVDPASDRYILMEINGRFCASTALVIDAGVNIPYLAYRLHSGFPIEPPEYRVGVSGRWLQGDFTALLQHLKGQTSEQAAGHTYHSLPSRSRALWEFLADFRPGMHYDEFKWNDWRPGAVEAMNWGRNFLGGMKGAAGRLIRSAPRWHQ